MRGKNWRRNRVANLGLKHHNWTNIKQPGLGPWNGSANPSQDARGHAIFTAPEWGLRATIKQLSTYWRKDVRTIKAIMEQWSPKNDSQGSIPGGQPNEPNKVAAFIADKMNLGVDEAPLFFCDDGTTIYDFDALSMFLRWLSHYELGQTPDEFYPTFARAVRLYYEKPK